MRHPSRVPDTRPAPARRSTDSRDYQAVPRRVAAMARDLADGAAIGWHSHPRFQLLYAVAGVMTVSTERERWVVPPQRAVWLPPGERHRLVASGAVKMRTLYVRADAAKTMPQRCTVLAVTPLLRELILRAMELPTDYAVRGPQGRLMGLLLDELATLPSLPYHLPMPPAGPLLRLCERLIDAPRERTTLDALARRHGTTARTLERHFRAQTDMTFSAWRRRARLLHALDWLARGRPILAVALDLGYAGASAFSAMFRREFGISPKQYRAASNVQSGAWRKAAS